MLETRHLAPRQPGAVYDAGMVVFIEHRHITPANQRADRPQVGLHAGREHQRRFLADPLGQLGFKLFVQLQRPVQKTGTGAARAIAVNGILGCLAHLGMRGQPEIIIRPAHDQTLAAQHRLSAFIVAQRDKIRINARLNCFFGLRKFSAFLKEIHKVLFLFDVSRFFDSFLRGSSQLIGSTQKDYLPLPFLFFARVTIMSMIG